MKVRTCVLAVALLLVATACPKPGPVEPPQLPNPASVYCEAQGGTLEIVETPEGQQGVCVLADGTRCDEWAFYRGECPGVAVQLESLYLGSGPLVIPNAPPGRSVSLQLTGPSDAEMEGTLTLDPNACSLNAFGDREICTLIAVDGIEVDVRRQRLADPASLMRRYYEVTGAGLPQGLALIVQGRLAEGELERSYLKLEGQLVPLFIEDGR